MRFQGWVNLLRLKRSSNALTWSTPRLTLKCYGRICHGRGSRHLSHAEAGAPEPCSSPGDVHTGDRHGVYGIAWRLLSGVLRGGDRPARGGHGYAGPAQEGCARAADANSLAAIWEGIRPRSRDAP